MSYPYLTWSHRDCRGNLDISSDGLSVRYRGSVGYTDERMKSVGTVKASLSFQHSGISYFEITVLSAGSSGEIGMGLVSAEARLSDMPGWGPKGRGWGYHADDGAVVIEGQARHYNKALPSTYSTNDTVGCGIRWDLHNGTIFFTKNGKLLGAPIRDITRQDLWPAVGLLSTAGEIRANFGQKPFMFDIGKYIKDPKAAHKHEVGLKQVATSNKHGWLKEKVIEGIADGAAGAGVAAALAS